MNIEKTIKNTTIAASVLSFAVFATMKTTGVIDWSWLWVAVPLWWPLVPLFVLAMVAYMAFIFQFMGSLFK